MVKIKNLAKDCGWDRYKGLRKPRCCEGRGCQTCWLIYQGVKANPTKKNFTQTDFTIILDRSGSMGRIADEMTQGLQDLVREQQKLKDKCNFTLVQFDYKHEMIINCVPIQDVPLSKLKLVPRGMTALYDTIGKTIVDTKERLARTKQKPKMVLYIITDGLNNASHTYIERDIRSMIMQCEAEGWQITYLGENAQRVAQSLGIKSTHTSDYSYTGVGTRSVVQTMGAKLSSVRLETDCNADLGKLTQLTPEDLKKLVA